MELSTFQSGPRRKAKKGMDRISKGRKRRRNEFQAASNTKERGAKRVRKGSRGGPRAEGKGEAMGGSPTTPLNVKKKNPQNSCVGEGLEKEGLGPSVTSGDRLRENRRRWPAREGDLNMNGPYKGGKKAAGRAS